jgi:hypothetical protein
MAQPQPRLQGPRARLGPPAPEFVQLELAKLTT